MQRRSVKEVSQGSQASVFLSSHLLFTTTYTFCTYRRLPFFVFISVWLSANVYEWSMLKLMLLIVGCQTQYEKKKKVVGDGGGGRVPDKKWRLGLCFLMVAVHVPTHNLTQLYCYAVPSAVEEYLALVSSFEWKNLERSINKMSSWSTTWFVCVPRQYELVQA